MSTAPSTARGVPTGAAGGGVEARRYRFGGPKEGSCIVPASLRGTIRRRANADQRNGQAFAVATLAALTHARRQAIVTIIKLPVHI
jgi:hypothetical protein